MTTYPRVFMDSEGDLCIVDVHAAPDGLFATVEFSHAKFVSPILYETPMKTYIDALFKGLTDLGEL